MGRKRHIVVDTQGCILRALVHEANIEDREGGLRLVKLLSQFDRLRHMWADRAYNGEIARWLEAHHIHLETSRPVQQPDGKRTYPRRWVVERTFAWLLRYRRLRCDYEFLLSVSAGFVYLASINLLLHRLAP